MGYPPMPRDPNDPYPPAQPQAPYPGALPQPPQVVYVQAPPSPVHARRGMSMAGHGMNWTLVLFTCRMWLPMYWSWWACVRSWQVYRNMRNRRKHRKVYG